MVEIMAHHSGQAIHQMETDIERDRFMTAEEAQRYEIIGALVAAEGDRSLAPLVKATVTALSRAETAETGVFVRGCGTGLGSEPIVRTRD